MANDVILAAALGAGEQGFVTAALALGAAEVTARAAGPGARRCAEAVAALQALPRPERARRLAQAIVALRRPQAEWLAGVRGR